MKHNELKYNLFIICVRVDKKLEIEIIIIVIQLVNGLLIIDLQKIILMLFT